MVDSNDYSKKEGYNVLKTDFKLMIEGVKTWWKTNTKSPAIVYIRKNGSKTSQYITYVKFKEMLARWDAYIKANKTEPNYVSIVKATPTPTPIPDPSPTPTGGLGIFIDPNDPTTPVDKINWKQLKKNGYTDVYLRTSSNGKYGIIYTNIPTFKKKCDEAGLNLHAWVWCEPGSCFKGALAADTARLGANICVDAEGYELYKMFNDFKDIRSNTMGKTFTLCVKPDYWDGGVDVDTLMKYSDRTMFMAYTGDYKKSTTQLAALFMKWFVKYPGRLVAALESYISDDNTTPKSNSVVQSEVDAVKPYTIQSVIFRLGQLICKYKVDGVVSGTDTGKFSPDADGCYNSPRFLQDWRIKQDTDVWCALNAIQQVIYELTGKIIEEKDIYNSRYTGSAGTAPEGLKQELIAQAKKLGINIKIESYSLSQIGWDSIAQAVADPKKGVFFHELYKNQWGHYDYPVSICPINIYMANSLQGQIIGYSRATMQSWFSGISGPSVYVVTLL